MNENINLCEILKDCPKGTKLYSPLYGEVEFIEILKENNTFPVRVTNGLHHILFSRNGRRTDKIRCQECMLFPSKDQRDWSKFKAPWLKKHKFDPKTLQPFDRVLVSDNGKNWRCDMFSNIANRTEWRFVCIGYLYNYCIPYNDETKHLVGTTDKASEYYRYWEE